MFINTITNQYPLTEYDIRNQNQHITFSVIDNLTETFEALGYKQVLDVRPTDYDSHLHKYYVRSDPTLVNDQWVCTYQLKHRVDDIEENSELSTDEKNVRKSELLLKIKQHKLNQLTTLRTMYELGGIEVNGIHVATDSVSQSKLMGAYVGMTINPDISIDWKNGDGTWITLDAPQIAMLSSAVVTHVQTCFTKEKTIGVLINNIEDINTIGEFDVEHNWQLLA